MINELVIAIVLTIGISALCSTLEALILSVTSAEIESLKLKSPKKGQLLELQNIKPNLQFLHIYTKAGQFVSHLRENKINSK